MLRASFIPSRPQRQLRDLTRYRRTLTQERTREKQRAEKLLEDAQLTLSSVISDIFDASGRAMLAVGELDVLRRQLGMLARRQPGCRALRDAWFGIGPVTAVAIWAELGDVRRFASSDDVVRHTGLDITVWSSDDKGPPGRLSRQGPPLLRFSSALAVSGCIGVAFQRRSRRAGGAVAVPPLRLLSDARAGHGCGARHMDGLGSRCLAGERRRGGSPSAARTGMPARAAGG